jgi:hypothetical protein
VITDRDTKGKLVSLFWGQRQLADASHVVVFAVKHPILAEDVRRDIERTAQVRGRRVEELAGFERVVNDFLENPPGSLDIKAWSSRQGVHRFGKLHDQRRTAGRGYLSHGGACPAGYRAAEDQYSIFPKVRFDKKDIITYLP